MLQEEWCGVSISCKPFWLVSAETVVIFTRINMQVKYSFGLVFSVWLALQGYSEWFQGAIARDRTTNVDSTPSCN